MTGPASEIRRRDTILVIYDDATARELIATYLAGEGFAVETAASGVDGLKKVRELRPATVTLDIMMLRPACGTLPRRISAMTASSDVLLPPAHTNGVI